MDELIVVACHGGEFIDQCRASLGEHGVSGYNIVCVDTSGELDHGADVAIHGGHPTGAYRWAIEHEPASDRYLFMQDSMTAIADPLPWFRGQFTGGAVAWGRFPMQWDNESQRAAVENRYVARPSHGIFGPVFYTSRAALAELALRNLLPAVPDGRIEAQGTERAWAYAYAQAGLEVTGPEWDAERMKTGFGPFRKVFAARP